LGSNNFKGWYSQNYLRNSYFSVGLLLLTSFLWSLFSLLLFTNIFRSLFYLVIIHKTTFENPGNPRRREKVSTDNLRVLTVWNWLISYWKCYLPFFTKQATLRKRSIIPSLSLQIECLMIIVWLVVTYLKSDLNILLCITLSTFVRSFKNTAHLLKLNFFDKKWRLNNPIKFTQTIGIPLSATKAKYLFKIRTQQKLL